MSINEGGLTIETGVPARMRDGTILRANVHRPLGDGPWPVLLIRLPYDRYNHELYSRLDPLRAAECGLMVVVQDTRGRFDSEGEWLPFADEREDGYDSVEWAAALPGSNGRVAMYGESYCGHTQWQAAIAGAPSLVAISPALTWSDPRDGLLARGGAVELGVALPWTLETGLDLLARSLPEEERAAAMQALLAEYEGLDEDGYLDLPIDSWRRRHEPPLPDLGGLSLLAGPAVAERTTVEEHHAEVAVPSLNIGGWYDIFLGGTIANHRGMTARGIESRLLIGPWTHRTFIDPIGDLCFGLVAGRFALPAALGGPADLPLTWLRSKLDPGLQLELPEKPVRYFLMGRNEWRDDDAWPPTEARHERLFLQSDGGLGGEPDAPGSAVHLDYDPADPVPTIGGHTVMSGRHPAGPLDQRPIEERRDVLVFTSDPLERELIVAGPVRVVLHASSSLPSADWVARLCDVHPDGRSINLCDGILRVAAGAEHLGRHEIDLWATANAFLPGHRLRVHVTGGSFPRWDRNLGGEGTTMRACHGEISLDAGRPSWVELSVLDC